MFDKMIESNSYDAPRTARRSYFLLSTATLAIMFAAGLVVSLFAQDFSLGTEDFEIAEVLAPLAPERPRPADLPRPQENAVSTIAIRQVDMLRVQESTKVPPTISSVPNTVQSRPLGTFILGNHESDASGPAVGSLGDRSSGTSSRVGSAPSEPEPTATESTPPPIKPAPAVKRAPVSIGVVNGIAKYLPKPPYSAAAQMMNARGEVNVQVTIDENGNVISAKAVSGHPLLRAPSERAALSARFTPTLLSNVPVKVTGVIVYKFTK